MPFRQIPEIGGDTLAGVDPRTGAGYPREWDRVAPSALPPEGRDAFMKFMEKRLEQLEQERQMEEFREALRQGKAT